MKRLFIEPSFPNFLTNFQTSSLFKPFTFVPVFPLFLSSLSLSQMATGRATAQQRDTYSPFCDLDMSFLRETRTVSCTLLSHFYHTRISVLFSRQLLSYTCIVQPLHDFIAFCRVCKQIANFFFSLKMHHQNFSRLNPSYFAHFVEAIISFKISMYKQIQNSLHAEMLLYTRSLPTNCSSTSGDMIYTSNLGDFADSFRIPQL